MLIGSALGTAFLKEEPPTKLPLREILLIKQMVLNDHFLFCHCRTSELNGD